MFSSSYRTNSVSSLPPMDFSLAPFAKEIPVKFQVAKNIPFRLVRRIRGTTLQQKLTSYCTLLCVTFF